MIVGALAGGLLGVFAFVSAPWVVAFAVVGALLAAAAATLGMRKTNRDFTRDAELDREIGVTGGSLGVPRRPQR